MKPTDVEFINRILNGDDTAFTELVKKYQKPVHALVWRKIGDFHIAEEITQDTFIKAYQGLAALKKPQRFASWLYVIAANNCSTWLRKKRVWMQSIENTHSSQYEKATYSQYVVEENERVVAEAQREVVKKLLEKLPESERTVITLHYFSEMSSAEIGAFLGVSANTIRSRLRRAQQRLKKEETMIRAALEHFQISPNLTDNIIQEIARLNPAAPSGSKPWMPWAVAASSVILVLLMLGISSQYLVRFQQPYSLDAQTEMTVELIDAPVVLNLDVKPDIRLQLGNSNALGKNENDGQKPDEVLLAAAQTGGEDVSISKQQWIQENGPAGSGDLTLFSTPVGETYILSEEGWNDKLYKLPVGGTEWQHVKDISPLPDRTYSRVPMAKWNDTFYVVVSHRDISNIFNRPKEYKKPNVLNELFALTDDGETWLSVGKCPEGMVRELVVMDETFYLALEHKIFVSEDTGKTWTAVDVGLTGKIHTLKAIHNMLFAAIGTGLYHLDAGSWQRVQFPVDEAKNIVSFAGTENNLYVMTEGDWEMEEGDWEMEEGDWENVGPQKQTWWIFRSTDKGQSWTDITPTDALPIMGTEPFENEPQATLAAMKNTLLVIGWRGDAVVRSIDNGNTWTLEKTTNISLMPYSVHNAVAVDENTFYLQGSSGFYRSIDAGLSWTRYNIGVRDSVINLIHVKTSKEQNTSDTLYAIFSAGMEQWVFKSIDKGKSWRVVNPEIQIKERIPSFTRIVESGGLLYAKSQGSTNRALVRLHRISEDGNTLVPIKGMPIFDSISLDNLLLKKRDTSFDSSDKSFVEQLQKSSAGATQFFKLLAQMRPPRNAYISLAYTTLRKSGLHGAFTVSGDTFYLEYNFKLFRWEPGDTEWYDTGVEETGGLSFRQASRELKLSASGNAVYVGKRDGHLVVSFDRGNNWLDLTPALPFPFKTFKNIVFAGSTVYVATDAGIITSDSGKNWRAVTDAEGTNLIMERLVVDGTTLYGITKETGVYRLESGTWKQVVSDMPENVTSLAVDGNTLYVGTKNSGMLHYNLEE